MKVCPKCGAKMIDESKFCENCGVKLDEIPIQKPEVTVPVMPVQETAAFVPLMPIPDETATGTAPSETVTTGTVPTVTPGGGKKKKSGGKIAVAVIIALLLGAVAFLVLRLFGSSSKAVALNECVDVSFAGYEGDGQVLCYVNPNTLKRQVEKALGETVETSEIERMQSMIGVEVTLKSKAPAKKTEDGDTEGEDTGESEELAFSETDITHLSKGDVVTVSIRYDELQQEYPAIEFRGKSFDVEVSEGLKSYAVLDPFRYMKLAFSKTSPFGQIDPDHCGVADDCPEEYLPYLQIGYFKADKTSDLAVGDVIHLTYSEDGQRAMREAGYKASQTEYDYTIQKGDMSRYITDLSEIDEAGWQGVMAEANDRVRSACVERYGDPDAATLVSAVFMVPKEGNWSQGRPHIILFYRADYMKKDGDNETPAEEYLAVSSSALWIEVPEEGAAETMSYSIPDFSGVNAYATQQEAENREIVQKAAFQSIRMD